MAADLAAQRSLKVLEKIHPKTRSLLRTHEPDLRTHLFGEKFGGTTGSVILGVRPWLEALEGRI
jgi:hypothetical protein